MENNIDYYMGTATFEVNIEAAADKATYKGQFKVKCVLSPFEYIKSDAMYRELLGKVNPQYANEYVNQLSYALAQLKYRVMEAPSWFEEHNGIKGSNVDDKVLLYVFDQAVSCEEEYRTGIEEKYKKAKGEVRKAVDDGKLSKKEKEEGKENKE